MKLKSKKK